MYVRDCDGCFAGEDCGDGHCSVHKLDFFGDDLARRCGGGEVFAIDAKRIVVPEAQSASSH